MLVSLRKIHCTSPVILRVWSQHQQYQHHLVLQEMQNSQTLSQIYWIRSSVAGAPAICSLASPPGDLVNFKTNALALTGVTKNRRSSCLTFFLKRRRQMRFAFLPTRKARFIVFLGLKKKFSEVSYMCTPWSPITLYFSPFQFYEREKIFRYYVNFHEILKPLTIFFSFSNFFTFFSSSYSSFP